MGDRKSSISSLSSSAFLLTGGRDKSWWLIAPVFLHHESKAVKAGQRELTTTECHSRALNFVCHVIGSWKQPYVLQIIVFILLNTKFEYFKHYTHGHAVYKW